MNRISNRPLYNDLAWAYDLIIKGPVTSRCDFVQNTAIQRGISSDSRILDAGCGTGSYSIELAKRGYTVTGLDVSAKLISVAEAKANEVVVSVAFQQGNILELPSRSAYDVILCRGVLNDIIDDSSRRKAIFSLTHALRKGGILILDVREWTASLIRKEQEPVFERELEYDNGALTFRAVTRLEPQTRRLLIKEEYRLVGDDGAVTTKEYDFVMRCWTVDELHSSLTDSGIATVEYLGDYDSNRPAGTTDRIVAIASI